MRESRSVFLTSNSSDERMPASRKSASFSYLIRDVGLGRAGWTLRRRLLRQLASGTSSSPYAGTRRWYELVIRGDDTR